jgi:hypothetical protein
MFSKMSGVLKTKLQQKKKNLKPLNILLLKLTKIHKFDKPKFFLKN